MFFVSFDEHIDAGHRLKIMLLISKIQLTASVHVAHRKFDVVGFSYSYELMKSFCGLAVIFTSEIFPYCICNQSG